MKRLIIAILAMLAINAEASNDYIQFRVVDQTDFITNKVDFCQSPVENAYWCYGRISTAAGIVTVIAYSKDDGNVWNLYDSSDIGEYGCTRVYNEFRQIKRIELTNRILAERNFKRYESNRYKTSKEQRQ